MSSQWTIASTRRRHSDVSIRILSGFPALPPSLDPEGRQRIRCSSMSDTHTMGRTPGPSTGPRINDQNEDTVAETQGIQNQTPPILTRGLVIRRPAGQRVQMRRNRPRQAAVFVVRDEVPMAPADRNVMENRERGPQPLVDNQNEDLEPPARVYLNVFIRSLWRASLNVLTQEFHYFVIGLIQNIGRGRGHDWGLPDNDDLDLPMLPRPEHAILPGPVPGPGPGHGQFWILLVREVGTGLGLLLEQWTQQQQRVR